MVVRKIFFKCRDLPFGIAKNGEVLLRIFILQWRKTKIAKTTSDVEKTMSYAGKIISDIIQTISDLFSAVANAWLTMLYIRMGY